MKLEKILARTLCDNGACGKIADYAVVREGTPINMRLHLCNNCINELYQLFSDAIKQKKEKK